MRLPAASDPVHNRVVVVTHNGVIRVFRGILEGQDVGALFAEDEPHLEPRTYTVSRTTRRCPDQQGDA